ncbi:MAG: hypothetical protein RL419_1683, partial [Actinomycetota bacterium]
WVKPTTIPTGGAQVPLLGKLSSGYGWDGYFLYLQTGGYINFHTNGTGIARNHTSTTNPLSAGQWYLITVVSQISSAAGSTKIYVNSTNVVSSAHGSDNYGESNTLYIGGTVFNEYLPARIGAFHAYDRALSVSEISASYTNFSNRLTSSICNQTVPEVSSFSSSQATPTNGASFTYALTFSEAVTGVDSGDFSNAGTATGCSFDPGTDASSASRTLTVSGCGEGTVQPRFAANGATSGSSVAGPSSAATSTSTITRDTTSPTVSSGSVSVNGGNVTLTLNEALGSTTAPASAYRVTAASVNYTPTAVSVSGSSVLLTLPVTLEGSVAVTASYTAPATNAATSNAALQDAAGNDAASFSGQSLTNNSTADASAPTVSTFSPADGATGVAVSSNLVVTFNESVVAVSGKDIVLRQSPSATVVETIPANDTSQVTISGGQVTINPSLNLNQGASYYVLIDAGAFRDSSNNTFAGISSASTWQFTTTSPATTTTSAASTSTTSTTISIASSTTVASSTTSSTASSTPATTVAVQQRPNTSVAGSSSTTTTEPQGQRAVSTLPSTTTTVAPAATTTANSSSQGGPSRSSTTSTSTTTTLPSSNEPIAPEPPEAAVGEAAALVDGQPIKSTVVKTTNAVMTIAGTVQVTVYAFDPEGEAVPVTLDGKILVEGGGSFGVRIAGFAPNSPVEAWLFSDPIRLGNFNANNYGKSTERFVVPADVEPGSHRVVLTGTNASGKEITIAVGLQVRGDTGEVPTSRIVIIAIAALALLGLLLPPSLRRRRAEPTESL